MQKASRGRHLVSLTPENICIDILSTLINNVVTISSQQQQERIQAIERMHAVPQEKSLSEISNSDEEVISPPKKVFIRKIPHTLTLNEATEKPTVCRKLFEVDSSPQLACLPESENLMLCDLEKHIPIPEESKDNDVLNEMDPLSISELDKVTERVQQVDLFADVPVINIITPQSDTCTNKENASEKRHAQPQVEEIDTHEAHAPEKSLALPTNEQPHVNEENGSGAQPYEEHLNENDNGQNLEQDNRSQPANSVDDFWDQENICAGKKRKPRKSQKESRKGRVERSLLRNTGQEYNTVTGKKIRARSIKELGDCRMKCKERIPDQVRKHFFSYYWTLGNYDERVEFVKNLIEPGKKKSARISEMKIRNRIFANKYYLKFAGDCFPICRGCLSKTLDETSKFLQVVTTKKQIATGFVCTAIKKRGGKKQTSRSQLEEAKEHILSFPAFESHYARSQTKKKFLPSDLNIATMYKLYRDQCENEGKKPVCLTTYTTIFRAQNISFKKPKVDTCGTCDMLMAKIKVAEKNNENSTQNDLQNQIEAHQALADKAYKEKDSDKTRAANCNDTIVATFDLQQCLPTPFLKSGVAFYKRQLWTYNLTIHVCNDNKVYCYMWHEASGARGGNQIASCVYHFIFNFVGENIKHLIFYSDSCSGQNKNNYMIAMFLTAIKKASNLVSIQHKFLVPGHTHLECDADHALIEKAKRNTTLDIHVPRDWYQLVRSVSKKNAIEVIEMNTGSFHNFSLLLRSEFTARKTNENKEKFLMAEVCEFKFQKELFPKVMYKKRELEEGEYKKIDYAKWGRKTYNQEIRLTPCYTEPLPISAEKMKDLESLFPFIDQQAQEFYAALKSDANVPITDPDLEDRSNEEV